MTRSKTKLKSVDGATPGRKRQAVPAAVLQPLFPLLFFACLLVSSCSAPPTAEQVLDDFLGRCDAALEKRSSRELRDLIADSYVDTEERTKKDVAGIATGYLLRNRAIYSYRLTKSLSVNHDDSISATILTALAARPITDISVLPTINSDIYWFEITIARGGRQWRLTEASWQQAMLEDFFQ